MYRVTTSLGIALLSFIIGCFFLWVYRQRAKDKEYLFVSLLSFASALYSGMAVFIQIHYDDPAAAFNFRRIALCGPILMVLFIIHFASIVSRKEHKVFLLITNWTYFAFCSMSLFDFHFYTKEITVYEMAFSDATLVFYKIDWGFQLFSITVPVALGYCFAVLRKAIKEGRRPLLPVLVGIVLLFLSGFYDLLWTNDILSLPIFPLFEFGYVTFIVCLTFTHASRYFEAKTHEEKAKRMGEEITGLREVVLNHSASSIGGNGNINLQSEKQAFFERAKKIVEANIHNPRFSIDRFAREMRLSKTHLNRRIKSLTGKNTSNFILALRLERARQLILKNSATISQIAFAVGFNNLSHFNRSFKLHFKTTPSKYRKVNSPTAP